MRSKSLMVICAAGCAVAPSICDGQSLLRAPTTAPTTSPTGTTDESAELKQSSFFFIEPPKAKTFQKHDQITILVEETSSQTSKQALDTKKDYTLNDALTQFPDLAQLLELRAEPGDRTNLMKLGISSQNKFKGDGTYTRSDRFSAKVTATVLDVKPNGILIIEARKTIQNNDEEQTIVLSGSCRSEDVTTSNTVLSSQLADLLVTSKTEGRVKESATKGWIPRVLEAIFNF